MERTLMRLLPVCQYERTLQQCRNDVFQMYARHYEASVRVETQGDLASRELCTMKHVQEVFSYGRCPAVSDERFVDGMAIELAPAAETDAFVARSPISADAHAEKLMAKFDCDVAISSSTLVTLFDVETHRLADSKVLGCSVLERRGLAWALMLLLVGVHMLCAVSGMAGSREGSRRGEQERRSEETGILRSATACGSRWRAREARGCWASGCSRGVAGANECTAARSRGLVPTFSAVCRRLRMAKHKLLLGKERRAGQRTTSGSSAGGACLCASQRIHTWCRRMIRTARWRTRRRRRSRTR